MLALIYVGSAVKLARPMATTMRMKLNLSIFVHMELYLHHMIISETEEEEQHWVTPNELLAASSDEFHTQYTYSAFSMLCFSQHSSTPPLCLLSLSLSVFACKRSSRWGFCFHQQRDLQDTKAKNCAVFLMHLGLIYQRNSAALHHLYILFFPQ